MCLDEKAKFQVRKENGNFVGWKIFQFRQKKYTTLFFSSSRVLKPKIWYKARIKEIECSFSLGQTFADNGYPTNYYDKYLSGFHCYRTLREAKKYKKSKKVLEQKHTVIAKVYLKGILATGLQDKFKVLVAREMKIIKKQE